MEGRYLRPEIRDRGGAGEAILESRARQDRRDTRATAFAAEFPAAGKIAGNLRFFEGFRDFQH
jgi:hypothetical protein